MKTRPGKTRSSAGFGLLLLLLPLLAYNLYDNQRFIIVEQQISLPRLPASFDGFKILQISDLHGRSFGKNQANLIAAINRLDYDMIAFTGDMNASTDKENLPESSKAILDLLDGLTNKEHLFWVDGNTGPYAMEGYEGALTGDPTAIGEGLQEKGCNLLTLPYAITRGDDRIWITPEMSEMNFQMHDQLIFQPQDTERVGGKENFDRLQSFHQAAYAAYQAINGSDEVKILLTHAPKQTNLTGEQLRQIGSGELDYDLILAGHFHGGQLRLPLIGALYIPSPTTGLNNSGIFPAQNAVKGLSFYGDVPQYVSAGLGASGHTRWATFRLFNTPEINLITLTR